MPNGRCGPSSFDSLALYLRDADGDWSGRRHGPEVARHASMRLALPAETGGEPMIRMASSLDHSRLSALVSGPDIENAAQIATRHYSTHLFHAVFIGVPPIVCTISFFTVPRERFTLWHVGTISGALGIAPCSGGFIHSPFSAIPPDLRWTLNL